MLKKLSSVTLFVRDIQEAVAYYTEKLGFKVQRDQTPPNGYRWVTVAPQKANETAITLVKADTEEKILMVGKQAVHHVFLVLETDHLEKTYAEWKARGVDFKGTPQAAPYGQEVVFADLYGNMFDLVEAARPPVRRPAQRAGSARRARGRRR